MARTMWAPGILRGCGARMRVKGTENIDPNQSYIFVSNHQSYLDIPALFSMLPVNLYFVAKKEVKRVPFVGWYMHATGMIFIDRSNRSKAIASLKKAGQLIKKGKNVIMFPEGTRARNSQVATFKKGPFVMASQSDISIVPVAIKGAENILKPGTFRLRPGEVIVNIGTPIHPKNESISDLIEHSRASVIDLLEEPV